MPDKPDENSFLTRIQNHLESPQIQVDSVQLTTLCYTKSLNLFRGTSSLRSAPATTDTAQRTPATTPCSLLRASSSHSRCGSSSCVGAISKSSSYRLRRTYSFAYCLILSLIFEADTLVPMRSPLGFRSPGAANSLSVNLSRCSWGLCKASAICLKLLTTVILP